MERPLDRRAIAWTLLLAQLGALVLFGHFLQGHDWEWGRERCALLAVLALVVLFARWPARIAIASRSLLVALWIAALLALSLSARTGIEAVLHTASTGGIRRDQRQNTLPAA